MTTHTILPEPERSGRWADAFASASKADKLAYLVASGRIAPQAAAAAARKLGL